MLIVLGALSAFGPLSMDLYLPSLPQLAEGLHTTDSLAQLTMSMCMIGLALGQLLAGPVSDRVGRLRPLLAGVSVFAVTALVCAAAPSIGVLIAVRLVQGLAGAAGIVVARAMVRDLYSGTEAARVFSMLVLVVGLAPMLAPMLGGQLLRITDWRGLFVALSLIGFGLLAAAVWALPETLPVAARHSGGIREVGQQFVTVWRDGLFAGCATALALGGCAMFTYISLGTFVLQGTYGVSAQVFSVIFAVNACGLMLAGRLNAALVGRFGPSRMLAGGLVVAAVAALLLVASVLFDWGLPGLLPPLFLIVANMGMLMPNTTALALQRHGTHVGMASAILGVMQFLAGAIVAPLASVGGASPTSMTVTMALGVWAALLVYATVVAPRARAASAPRSGTP